MGHLILDAYVQPEALIDLTTDEDEPQILLGEWIVLDELDESMSEPDAEDQSEPSEDEAPDMLLDFDNLAALESDYDSHSESDYLTSESEDSGIDY
jgi:hypothetical protein